MHTLHVLYSPTSALCAEVEAPDNASSAPPSAPAAAAAQGIDLDEEAQLELAMFLSLQEETQKAARAASPPDATPPESSQIAANRAAAATAEELHSTAQNSGSVRTEPQPSGVSDAALTDTALHQVPAAAVVGRPQHDSMPAQLSGATRNLQHLPCHMSQASASIDQALLQQNVGQVLQPSQTEDQAPTGLLETGPSNQHLGSQRGSVHSDLSSAGPAGSPIATDSESDTWHFFDDATQQSAPLDLPPAADAAPQAVANEAASSDVPVGQAIAESLRSMQSVHSMTSTDSAGRTEAVPTEQFAALSLVDLLASNPDGEDQLQLETENSRVLQYYLDPANGVLPHNPLTQTAAKDDRPEMNPFEALLPLSSSPRAGGTVSGVVLDDSPFWVPDAAPPVAAAGSEHVQSAQATPLSPRSQLHETVLGNDVLGSSFTAAADHGGGECSSEATVGHQQNWQATSADTDAPARMHVHQGDCLPLHAVHGLLVCFQA